MAKAKQECGKYYTDHTIAKLFGLSGNMCSMTGCNERLIYRAEGELFGIMAHIHDRNPPGVRYRADLTCKERNDYDNLIALCPNHHTLIDKIQPTKWTPDRLKQMKADHEASVDFMTVPAADIEFATEYIRVRVMGLAPTSNGQVNAPEDDADIRPASPAVNPLNRTPAAPPVTPLEADAGEGDGPRVRITGATMRAVPVATGDGDTTDRDPTSGDVAGAPMNVSANGEFRFGSRFDGQEESGQVDGPG